MVEECSDSTGEWLFALTVRLAMMMELLVVDSSRERKDVVVVTCLVANSR
jgi:hypothetical protein